MAAVRVHHKNRSAVISVKEGDKMSVIKGLALSRFELQGREGRLSVRSTGFELMDDEAIESAPGVTVDLLRQAAARASPIQQSPPPPESAMLEATQAQLMSLDETQFEVLRDPSVLGPAFDGSLNSPQGLAYRLHRQFKFQQLLRADFAGNVDRWKLEQRIERILTSVQEDMGIELPSRKPLQEDGEVKEIQQFQNLTVVLELQLQAPCFYSSFRPVLSPSDLSEGEERPESGRILVCYEESLQGLCALLGRKLSATPDQMIIRPQKRRNPYRWDEQNLPIRDDTFVIQRLGRTCILVEIEKSEEVHLEVDFGWSIGELQWTIRRLAPQLRKVEFNVFVGTHDLFSLGDGLATPLGHVYLGMAPLTVKVVLDYGGRPMAPSRRTLVPPMEEEEEEALDGPANSLSIARVTDLAQFMRLQNQTFQMAAGHCCYSLGDLRRKMAARAAGTVDRGEAFVPPASGEGLGKGQVFLKLPPRALFYIRVEVKESDCVHVLPWVLPNMKLKAFQVMLAEASGVPPEDQSLTFCGRSLHQMPPEVSLQSLGIRKSTELLMRRSFRVQLQEVGSGAIQSVRVGGHLSTLLQLRLELQSRLGVDADALRLELAGKQLPLNGDLRQLGIAPGAILAWHRPLRATFRLDEGLRADLVLFADDLARRVIDFANARRGAVGREQPAGTADLEVWLPGSPVRMRIQWEEESLERNGLTGDFQVVLRPARKRG